MKAIVYRRHGPPDVLEYEEIEKPAPRDDEVLLKVRAAAINPLDWRLMRGLPGAFGVLVGQGRKKLERPGVDVAGEVEAVGRNVTSFKPGDAVFGACRGAFAEYACASESRLARKPDNITFEQAAGVAVAGLTALQGLRDKGELQPGAKVLINGASGGVGTFAVQLARSFGARVTGVSSIGNQDLVRSLGADHVIDYGREDFTRMGERYDLVFDTAGNHSAAACRRVLTRNGVLVVIGGPKGVWPMVRSLGSLAGALLWSRFAGPRVRAFIARVGKEDLAFLGEQMKAGKIVPVVDRQYRLSEAREAMRHAEEGHPRGKVVLTT